jgi:uncharacterized membrane protein
MIAASKPTKILSLALIASLGGNLFMAGWLFTGASLRPGSRAQERGNLREALNASLSKPGAIELTYALDQVREQFEIRLDAVRSDRTEEPGFLASDRFDRAGFLAERTKIRAAFSAAAAESDKIVADALAQLSLEDRHKLASMRLPPPLGEAGRRPPR